MSLDARISFLVSEELRILHEEMHALGARIADQDKQIEELKERVDAKAAPRAGVRTK